LFVVDLYIPEAFTVYCRYGILSPSLFLLSWTYNFSLNNYLLGPLKGKLLLIRINPITTSQSNSNKDQRDESTKIVVLGSGGVGKISHRNVYHLSKAFLLRNMIRPLRILIVK